ncbi:MAG: pyrimidine dimer DNA glycosylase/endonuclease V [Flavobacteriales bacterium]
MSRINAGIEPHELSRKHLIAEHREIKRIPNLIAKKKYHMDGIPENFKLGKGHVKFFYDKLYYLKKRYDSLYKECIKRGYNVSYYGRAWDNVPNQLYNDWVPDKKVRQLVKERIKEKEK